MATSHQVYSNFFSRNDIVKHVALVQGKNLLIDALRELFTNDSLYPYRQDEFGFPLVPDHTNLPIEEGGTGLDVDGNPIINPSPDLSIDAQLSTKILITSTYRQDVKFYPVITVKQTNLKDHPISFNQNAIQIHYRKEFIRDGYGNQIEIRTPTHFVFGDAWDQSFEIKIIAEDLDDRDQIADIVNFGLWNLKRDELRASGLFIKNITGGGETEEENLKDVSKWLYTYTITVNTYSEWSREIPIRNVIERINFYFDIVRTGIQPSGSIDVLDNAVPNSATLIAVMP
jgi:hypothetical protein